MSNHNFKPAKPGNWGVKDKNARMGARVHEPVLGVTYALTAAEFTSMPAAHAAKFLLDPSFLVVDEEGAERHTLPQEKPAQQGGATPALAPGQVIASLDELETKALFARAVRLPGGEKFNAKTKKTVLVDFLLSAGSAASLRAEPDEAPAGDDDVEVEIDDEPDPDEVEAMFDKA